MAVNQVIYNGETIVDLTGDTVRADTLAEGVTAHDASGQQVVGTLVTTDVQTILQAVYPIGSVCILTVGTNPSTLYGFGTWEQIKDTFLLAAGDKYAAGSTGGEATHTLLESEMPAHTHAATSKSAGAHTHKIGTDKDVDYLAAGDCWSVHSGSSGADYLNGYTSSAGAHTHTITVESTGSGSAHNNMPPYLAVYVWKRVA